VPYPKDDIDKAKKTYAGGVLTGMESGFVALYQKCVHLGCRVPWCKSSQWFECPCHGSKYNRVGEKKGGPAPRGLDRFPVAVSGGQVEVDTGGLSIGPPIGTNTTGQEAEGPHCA
jgi:cytochrome b6-f complex iron-sulfur subunit